MQPITVTVGPLAAADADIIAASQVVGSGGGDLTLTSTPYVQDTPRQVLLTNGGNDVGVNFTVYGTGINNEVISEVLAGTNGGTAATALDFKTVTRIAASAQTSASGVTVGTNTHAGSRWVRLDDFAPGQVTVQVNVSGTINYTVQTTLDDPNDPFSPVAPVNVAWLTALDTGLSGQNTNKSGYIAYAPRYVRVYVNSGTGTATATFLQSSNGPI